MTGVWIKKYCGPPGCACHCSDPHIRHWKFPLQIGIFPKHPLLFKISCSRWKSCRLLFDIPRAQLMPYFWIRLPDAGLTWLPSPLPNGSSADPTNCFPYLLAFLCSRRRRTDRLLPVSDASKSSIELCVCCFVLLNRYWGIVMYGPGVSSWASQGRRTHDPRSPTS